MTQHSLSTGLLTNKVALITGAGRGIGAAAARLFAYEGAAVVLASRTEAELGAVVREIKEAGGTADYVVTDLADAVSIQHAVQTVVDRHGRLDIAFNNAGVSISHGPLTAIPENDFDVITAVNYKGVWLSMVVEIRAILATAGTGAIVNNSSVAASEEIRGSARMLLPSGPSTVSPRPPPKSTDRRASASMRLLLARP